MTAELYVTTEVPIELIFTDVDVRTANKEHTIPSFTEEWFAHHKVYSDVSLMRMEPHQELFRYFYGETLASPEPYLDWYEGIHRLRGIVPPMEREGLLNQKRMEFENMRFYLQNDPSYFTDHPPQVTYRTPGRFNIQDGHHRAAFLYCSGLRRIPVRMPRADYERWMNPEALEDTLHTMAVQQRDLIYTPILHPRFYEMRSERDEFYKTRLDVILEYLGPRNLKRLKVLDIGCNIGYYARHFTREGARVTGIEPDPQHTDLLMQLNRLERADFELVCEPLERLVGLQGYEVGLLLTVFYHFMGDPDLSERFLGIVDCAVQGLLFWESGDRIEEEKSLLFKHTGFEDYVKLADTFGTGKYRELGVFLKRPR
ncbi:MULTISPECIES: class I SAM-dependent methyltransferase [Paenibacillus]|uniref:class I SAM-dependent methyltransferase n=1 Tax=Paenibacillus TaxID=44249 RepID=UPI002FDF3239